MKQFFVIIIAAVVLFFLLKQTGDIGRAAKIDYLNNKVGFKDFTRLSDSELDDLYAAIKLKELGQNPSASLIGKVDAVLVKYNIKLTS